VRVFRLPDDLRVELRRGVGLVIRGDYRSVALSVVEVVGDCSRLWAVGDVVCSSLVDVGCVPKVCVVDGRTLRGVPIDYERLKKMFSEVVRVRNPPGCVSEDALRVIKYCVSRSNVLVLVDGEEDLIGLLVLMFADLGDYLVYGLPGIGVDVVEVNEGSRGWASGIISKFKEDYIIQNK
jgi:uncharacterized protein (UPF0218 family)